MSGAARPIGYWLKLLDRLIEEDLDRTLVPFDLTRRQWQILNVLAGSPGNTESIYRELKGFLVDQAQVDSLLHVLVSDGWIETAPTG